MSVQRARPGRGFTLPFEAFALMLVAQLAVLAAGRLMQITDTRPWRISKAYVEQARTRVDLSKVTMVAVDETSSRKGRTCVSLFGDPEPSERKVLFVTTDKDQTTFDRFLEDVPAHGGKGELVSDAVDEIRRLELASRPEL